MRVKYFQVAKLTKESETTHFPDKYCDGSYGGPVISAAGVLLF